MCDCPAHARKVNGLMAKIASAAITKERNVRKEADVSLNSSRPGAGVGQFMRFFSTEGALSRVAVREFEKRRFPIRFTFGTAAPQS